MATKQDLSIFKAMTLKAKQTQDKGDGSLALNFAFDKRIPNKIIREYFG